MTDFAAFGAPANASVFGTKVASTPFSLAGGKAAFGSMRTNSRGVFDAEDEDDEGQKVELREDSISLDQVCTVPGRIDRHKILTSYHFRLAASRCRVLGEVLDDYYVLVVCTRSDLHFIPSVMFLCRSPITSSNHTISIILQAVLS